MDVCVVRGLGVPYERAVRETDMPAVRMQRFEQGPTGCPWVIELVVTNANAASGFVR